MRAQDRTKFLRTLKRLGMKSLQRKRGKGSHQMWVNPETGRRASVPNSKMVPVGTATNILHLLGITKEEYEREAR